METINLNTKILVYKEDETNEETKNLIEQAKQATKKAYVPYSNFHVGSAILLANGKIVVGNNQENAAYPSGLCAERVGIYHASSHYPEQAIRAIAVAAYYKGEFTDDPCTPCGSCRQSILEFENHHKQKIRMIMYGKKKIVEVESIKDLLPLSFGEEALR